MSPRYAGPAAVAVGVALAALVVMSAESVCGVLLRRRGPLQWVSPAACAQAVADGRHVLGAVETRHGIFPQPPAPVHVTGPDPVVSYASDQVEDLRFPVNVGERVGTGLVWLPHKSFRFVRRVKGGKVIWDVPCRIDEFGRRDTPGEREKVRAERFVLLLGDSFVLGDCVGQDETMAATLGRALAWARVYNYGVSGLFPGELLERMRLIKGPPEIRESKGTALFFLSDAVIRRNMYSLASVGGWGYSRPYYHENERGEIVADQYTKDARPVWTFLAKLFVRSRVMRYLNLDFPLHPADPDLRFMAKMIAQLRDETRRFGADQFYVVIYPGSSLGRTCVPYLEKADIAYIDLACWDLFSLTRGPAFIPGEGHPTPETHRLLAEALAQVLSSSRRAKRPSPAPLPRRGI